MRWERVSAGRVRVLCTQSSWPQCVSELRWRLSMNLLGTTKRWERKTSARFWSAPVLWRFPTRSKAAEDCRPSSVAALRRVDSPRRWREDQRSLRFMVPMRAPRARKLSMNRAGSSGGFGLENAIAEQVNGILKQEEVTTLNQGLTGSRTQKRPAHGPVSL